MIGYLAGVAAVAMMISLAAYVSAFESNIVNITSFVRQAFNTEKTFVPAVLPPANASFETLNLYHQDRDGDGDIDCDEPPNDPDRILRDEFGDPVLETDPDSPNFDQPIILPVQDNCYDPRIAFPPTVGFPDGRVDVVQAGVIVCWDLNLLVTNETGVDITQVVVRDKFSSELNGVPLDDLPVTVNPVNFGKGKGHKKKPSNAALEITWWVDYLPGLTLPPDGSSRPHPDDSHNGVLVPGSDGDNRAFKTTLEGVELNEIDDFDDNKRTPAPGSSTFAAFAPSVSALMLACTDRNPADKQSYTTGGCYTLNSGLNVKWLTLEKAPEGQHFEMSFSGPPLLVWASVDQFDREPNFQDCDKK